MFRSELQTTGGGSEPLILLDGSAQPAASALTFMCP